MPIRRMGGFMPALRIRAPRRRWLPRSALAAPQHELERWIVIFASFDREIEQRLALRGAGGGFREDHCVAKDDGAVIRPEIEMADPEPRVHVHQKIGDVGPANLVPDPHVERGRQVKRLQIVTPGEIEMMIRPTPRDGQIQFVPSGPFEMPAAVLDRLLEHVERMGTGQRLIWSGCLSSRNSYAWGTDANRSS